MELDPVPAGLGSRVAAVARMIWSSASRRGLARVIDDFRPDVVHLHNIYHQLSPSVLAAARAAKVPCVLTLHDYKLACPSYQMLDNGTVCDACVTGGPWQAARRRCKDGSLGASTVLAVESWLHRSTRAYAPVQAFVSPSRFLAAVMRRAGVFPDRMHVVNHFVDAKATQVKPAPGGGVVFAGRLSVEKGVDVLIEAVARLSPEVVLDVAGDGPARPHLEELAARRAPGRVRFHGRLDKARLARRVPQPEGGQRGARRAGGHQLLVADGLVGRVARAGELVSRPAAARPAGRVGGDGAFVPGTRRARLETAHV